MNLHDASLIFEPIHRVVFDCPTLPEDLRAAFAAARMTPVADLDALKRHLDSGHLSGAAVDVFPVEPKKSGDPFDTDLADEDNMILTPHIGGSTLEAQKSIGHFVSQRLEEDRRAHV